MDFILEDKIRIGISACMYGAKTRYNGKGRDKLDFLKRDKNDFLWTPVCPEVMAGMGVPRDPIRLVDGNGFDFWNNKAKVRTKSGRYVTKVVKEGAQACFDTLKRAEIDAFVYMEGSPSCGVHRTTLRKQSLGKPPGIFGALLLNEEVFLIPSTDLQSPIKWWDNRRRLTAFTWFKRVNIESLEDLSEAWHIIKVLCQEIEEVKARNIGHKMASLTNQTSIEELEDIRKEILVILKTPSDPTKIKQWLWKNYSHIRKSDGVTIEGIYPPELLRSVTCVTSEVISIEIEAKKKGFLFGSSPILYKPKR